MNRWAHMAAAVAAGAIGLGPAGSAQEAAEPLLCYVGGTMRPAMEEIARLYEVKTGRKIAVDYADSGELMIKIEQTRKGDLYVAHDPFLGAVMSKGLGERGWTVAALDPVIVVAKGNPKKVAGLRDLARPGLKLVLPDAEYSTTGHIVSRMAAKAGIEKTLEANVVARQRGGSAAANAVALGTANAAVVWNAVAFLRRDVLDAVPIEADLALQAETDAVTTATYGRIEMDYVRVTIATLKFSKDPAGARAFAEFVAAEENRGVWDRLGFSKPRPDRPHPAAAAATAPQAAVRGGELLVHCAAGMRAPVAAMAEAFEKKEGVTVQLSYDGSNRLLGQIKLTRRGDLYIAGDADYMEMAAKDGLVAKQAPICWFVPVILVAKGNPKGVKSLADLTAPGVRVGQGEERSAAVGRLMPKLLDLNGVDREAWRRNVLMETATVNELGVAVKLGTLDAAVVWDAIAAAYADVGEAVAIDRAKNICPEVGAAVLTSTRNPPQAEAFLAFMVSDDGRAILKANGYTVAKP